MKSKAPKIPTTGGKPFGGGFYAGRFFDKGVAYALIVAPRAQGEQEKTTWNASEKAVKGALSYSDGLANTAAMAKAGSALAKWAQGLAIGGHKDWYLPSRVELLVAFGELRQVKAFAPGKPNGFAESWYWSSTQSAGTDACAWYQSFSYGGQGSLLKDFELRARAVRRLTLE